MTKTITEKDLTLNDLSLINAIQKNKVLMYSKHPLRSQNIVAKNHMIIRFIHGM